MENKILEQMLIDEQILDIIKNLSSYDPVIHHFGLGSVVRNKYLWSNLDEATKLYKYYDVDNIDSLSSCLIQDVINIIKSKSRLH